MFKSLFCLETGKIILQKLSMKFYSDWISLIRWDIIRRKNKRENGHKKLMNLHAYILAYVTFSANEKEFQNTQA